MAKRNKKNASKQITKVEKVVEVETHYYAVVRKTDGSAYSWGPFWTEEMAVSYVKNQVGGKKLIQVVGEVEYLTQIRPTYLAGKRELIEELDFEEMSEWAQNVISKPEQVKQVKPEPVKQVKQVEEPKQVRQVDESEPDWEGQVSAIKASYEQELAALKAKYTEKLEAVQARKDAWEKGERPNTAATRKSNFDKAKSERAELRAEVKAILAENPEYRSLLSRGLNSRNVELQAVIEEHIFNELKAEKVEPVKVEKVEQPAKPEKVEPSKDTPNEMKHCVGIGAPYRTMQAALKRARGAGLDVQVKLNAKGHVLEGECKRLGLMK